MARIYGKVLVPTPQSGKLHSFHCSQFLITHMLFHCATSRKVAGSISDVSLEFFIDIILLAALWPWGDSAYNRNEYQEYFLGVKVAGA